MSGAEVLRVEGLRVRFAATSRATRRTELGDVLAGVSLSVGAGEVVGVIGETGSGKTTLARAVVGLGPPVEGSIRLEGREIAHLRGRERRALRRSGAVQLVFQDPLRSLDPDLSVADSVGEGLAVRGAGPAERSRRVGAALELVGLDPTLAGRRPGELSGGQRQRVAIARAVALEPRLLLCDEPVSALDASSRNAILRLLHDLRDRVGLALMVISHDLGSLAGVADRVAVLYRGRIVEQGPTGAVFAHPRHPYTALLIASAPHVSRARLGFALEPEDVRRAAGGATLRPGGCVFAPRCRFADPTCVASEPALRDAADGQLAACHHAASWPLHVRHTFGTSGGRSPVAEATGTRATPWGVRPEPSDELPSERTPA